MRTIKKTLSAIAVGLALVASGFAASLLHDAVVKGTLSFESETTIHSTKFRTTTNGTFTNLPLSLLYTNFYQVAPTNLLGRYPATNVSYIFDGHDSLSNALEIGWMAKQGASGYVIARSFNAGGDYTNWNTVAANDTNWVDFNSNTWTLGDYSTNFVALPDPLLDLGNVASITNIPTNSLFFGDAHLRLAYGQLIINGTNVLYAPDTNNLSGAASTLQEVGEASASDAVWYTNGLRKAELVSGGGDYAARFQNDTGGSDFKDVRIAVSAAPYDAGIYITNKNGGHSIWIGQDGASAFKAVSADGMFEALSGAAGGLVTTSFAYSATLASSVKQTAGHFQRLTNINGVYLSTATHALLTTQGNSRINNILELNEISFKGTADAFSLKPENTPADGSVMTYNAAKDHWTNSFTIDQSAKSDGDVLVYRSAQGQYTNEAQSGGTLATSSQYTATFRHADLAAGVLTVDHGLASTGQIVQVFRTQATGYDEIISPDAVSVSNMNTVLVDLTTFGSFAWTGRVTVAGSSVTAALGNYLQSAQTNGWDVSGGGTDYSFRATYSSNDWHIVNNDTRTRCQFETEAYDNGNWYSNENFTAVVPASGLYYFFANYHRTHAQAAGKRVEFRMITNGITVQQVTDVGPSAAAGHAHMDYPMAATLPMTAGDLVHWDIWHNHGSSRFFGSGSTSYTNMCWFEGRMVRED